VVDESEEGLLAALRRFDHRKYRGSPLHGSAAMLPLRPMPHPTVDEDNHPEALALPMVSRQGIDVGVDIAKYCRSASVDILARVRTASTAFRPNQGVGGRYPRLR